MLSGDLAPPWDAGSLLLSFCLRRWAERAPVAVVANGRGRMPGGSFKFRSGISARHALGRRCRLRHLRGSQGSRSVSMIRSCRPQVRFLRRGASVGSLARSTALASASLVVSWSGLRAAGQARPVPGLRNAETGAVGSSHRVSAHSSLLGPTRPSDAVVLMVRVLQSSIGPQLNENW